MGKQRNKPDHRGPDGIDNRGIHDLRLNHGLRTGVDRNDEKNSKKKRPETMSVHADL